MFVTAALQKNLKHFCYLVENRVIYALFSDNLDKEHEKALAQKRLFVKRPDFFCHKPPILLIEIQLWQT